MLLTALHSLRRKPRYGIYNALENPSPSPLENPSLSPVENPSLSAGLESANFGSNGKHDNRYTTKNDKANLNIIYELSPCLKENTTLLNYKEQLVDAVYGNDRCLP
jgi:hypothetical protein